jgi:hypothetical protein
VRLPRKVMVMKVKPWPIDCLAGLAVVLVDQTARRAGQQHVLMMYTSRAGR